MTQDTTPTSGAADLPEALHRSTAADGKTELFNLPGYPLMVRAVDFNRLHTESEMRRTALLDEMQKAALAAGQATAAPAQPAAQQGVAYAALPDEVVRLAQVAIRECQYKGNDMPQDWMDSAMRACRLKAASHGQAPAGAAPECLTCSDHGAVGNILTAEPCPDCTRLNAQPAPATQLAGESVYAFRGKGLEDFCTCDEARYEELSNKPHLFETRLFYTAP